MTTGPRLVVLAGGVGGARFLLGLRAHLRAAYPGDGATGTSAQVTVVVNTGDDMWLHGLRVCPDLDTVMYTLGGVVHPDQGWGRAGETQRVAGELAAYGLRWDWFTLGDLDLATDVARTELLRAGLTLTEVTARLAERWRPGVRLLPMSDQPVETHVEIDAREVPGDVPDPVAAGTDATRLIHFEEWWVRYHAALPARRFVQVGLELAAPAPGVLEAVRDADAVLLPPSNPVVSVGTVLAVAGVRDAVVRGRAPVVGVSPIIGGAPVRGMADACLAVIGVETSASAVARHYGARRDGGLLDGWLVAEEDAACVGPLAEEGIATLARPLLLHDVAAAADVARAALELAGL